MEILRLLVDGAPVIFEVDRVEKKLWKFSLIVVLFCCDISEVNDISYINNFIARTRPCVRCRVPLDEFPDLRESDKRQLG